MLLHSHTEFDANRLIICRVIALERFLLCVETCQLLWLSYYKITSKLDTNVPLGINHLHRSLTVKTLLAPKKFQNGRQKIQNGRHNFNFSQFALRRLTNLIYSKNIKVQSTLLKYFEKKIIKIGLFLKELRPLKIRV